MYHKFVKVVKLTVNEQAKGTALEQEQFRTILTNLRDGNSMIDEHPTIYQIWNLSEMTLSDFHSGMRK